MRGVFADPKSDLVFKKIFGEPGHEHLLIALLNDLLGLEDSHRIDHVELLPPEQHHAIPEIKYSVCDVKCREQSGALFIVEMQLLNVAAFEQRIVYGVAKAYSLQLKTGVGYTQLHDVVGLTICNFDIWDDPQIPMLSRWRMREERSLAEGLSQLRFVFLELPKYRAGEHPETLVDKWAYFFRYAIELPSTLPTVLAPAQNEALEIARFSAMSEGEFEWYERAMIGEQDAINRVKYAENKGLETGMKRGMEQGIAQGMQQGMEIGRQQGLAIATGAIIDLCEVLGIAVTDAQKQSLASMSIEQLDALRVKIKAERTW